MANANDTSWVNVCDYDRIRFGRLEHVRRHRRPYPRRRKAKRNA